MSLTDSRDRPVQIYRRASYDGIALELLAAVSGYEQFEFAFAERQPVDQETLALCLDGALRCCNVDVVRFLFERQLASVEQIKREKLAIFCMEWSDRRYAHNHRGERLINLLINYGVDFHSPLELPSGKKTPLELLTAQGTQKEIEFLANILKNRRFSTALQISSDSEEDKGRYYPVVANGGNVK